MQTYFKSNSDGSCDIILYMESSELAIDFDFFKKIINPRNLRRAVLVRSVKIIIAGTLVVSIPFNIFARVGNSSKYAMSYIYFGSEVAQLQSVAPSVSTLSTVSPSYFNLNDDGSLALSSVSHSFITSMHNSGIKVVPFLSNHWDKGKGEAALNNPEQLVSDIVKAISKYNLDGVNIDIENVNEAYREKYVTFTKLLRDALSSEKEVSVAVAANPNNYKNGWHGSYDYQMLGEVADHILIMAYDEHYYYGEAGSVASLSFVENSIKYALNYVPSDKIVLGIPFYGRIWGGTTNGYGLSLTKINEYIETYDCNTYFDTNTETPYTIMNITDESNAPTVNGKRLAPGSYTIHYENADSIKEKLALVNKYNLKGAGNWSAGQEPVDVWDYYELWLTGKYFSDISDSFAKDDIIKVTSDGIMEGISNTEFSPNTTLTRAQAAAICSRILNLPEGNDKNFTDVPSSHWAVNYISAVVKAGIFKGYSDKTFHPDSPVTRAEMSAVLSRFIETSATGSSTFSDVPETHWAIEEITSLSQMGVLNGYPDSTFRPDSNITRGEASAVLNRISDYLK